MAYTRLTNDLNVIQKLPDDPNDSGGLSAEGLKAKFDEAVNTIKTYINSTLLAELEGEDGASNIGIDTIDGIDSAENVQDALEAIMQSLQSVTQSGVADGSITTEKLATAAVIEAKIAAGAVTADKIAANAVASAALAAGAVTAAKIAAGAVETAKLADHAVTASKIASGSVITSRIADGAVNSNKLGASSVITAKIADNAVTAGKISNEAVSTLYSGTLAAASWSGNSAPYSQAVTVAGVLDTDYPVVDLVPSSNYSTAVNEDAEWGSIYKAVASANAITFYAKAKPTIALNFKARCIRK